MSRHDKRCSDRETLRRLVQNLGVEWGEEARSIRTNLKKALSTMDEFFAE